MAGVVLVIAGVAAGLLTAVLTVPYAAQVLSVVSFAYLGFIAYRIATAGPVGEGGGAAAAPGFLSGLVLNLTNLKAYAAFAALAGHWRELLTEALVSGGKGNGRSRLAAIVAGTAIVGVIALFAESAVESVLREPWIVAAGLILAGGLLYAADRMAREAARLRHLNLRQTAPAA